MSTTAVTLELVGRFNALFLLLAQLVLGSEALRQQEYLRRNSTHHDSLRRATTTSNIFFDPKDNEADSASVVDALTNLAADSRNNCGSFIVNQMAVGETFAFTSFSSSTNPTAPANCPLSACRRFFDPNLSEMMVMQMTGDGTCATVEILSANFNPVLGIIEADSIEESLPICRAEDDDSGEEDLPKSPAVRFQNGQNYFIVVSASKSSSLGSSPTFNISVLPSASPLACPSPPSSPVPVCGNEAITTNSIALGGTAAVTSFNNPSFPPTCPLSACRSLFTPKLSEMVVFQLTGDGTCYDVEILSASYDTVLGIIEADDVTDTAPVCHAEDDDQGVGGLSRVSNVMLEEGQNYFLVVSAHYVPGFILPISNGNVELSVRTCAPRRVFCFPEDGMVQVENQGPTPLRDVHRGDRVMAETGRYEPVYTFGHKIQHQRVDDYLQISTSGAEFNGDKTTAATTTLTLSRDHMVFVGRESRAIPASRLQVGDLLQQGDVTQLVNITDIQTVSARGLYAPFTPSGSLVVNGIRTSVYASLQGTETVQVQGYSTFWTHHSLYQLLLLPLRWSHQSGWRVDPMGLKNSRKEEETYRNGVALWLYYPLQVYHWWLGQCVLVQSLVGVVFAGWVVVMLLLDMILQFPAISLLLLVFVPSLRSLFFRTKSL